MKGRSASPEATGHSCRPWLPQAFKPRNTSGGQTYFIFIGIGQGLGCLCVFRKIDIESQDISLSVAGRVVFANGLVELGPLFAPPRIAKFIIT